MGAFKVRYFIIVFFVSVIMISSSSARMTPTSLATDTHVQVVSYDANQVYRLKGMHGYTSTIQLSVNEGIISANIGDKSAWEVNAKAGGNTINIKPVAIRADTNLNVITTRGHYQFLLHTPRVTFDKSGRLLHRTPPHDVIFLLRFIYPEEPIIDPSNTHHAPKLFSHINMQYSARGNPSIAPTTVFDDGKFTYFKFAEQRPIPAIFLVDHHGQESLLNYRVKEPYVVVEHVGRHFDIRHGSEFAAVFNEA